MRTTIAVALTKGSKVVIRDYFAPDRHAELTIAKVFNGTPVFGEITWLGHDGIEYGPIGALDEIQIINY